MRAKGIPVFGPDRAAAELEGSKSFAKQIMESAGVPTAAARELNTQNAREVLAKFTPPYVVKADGLAAGKGVLVTTDLDEAVAHVEVWAAHGKVIAEEYLDGREVSLFFFADGKTVRPLSPAQDYKRIYDGDKGPNTGGMGAYSPLGWLPQGFVAEVTEKVAQPVISELAKQGKPFRGLLYCGLIVTAKGIRVIEFNARFGDPETQVVLPRMVSPLSEYLLASARGSLEQLADPLFNDDAAVVVVLASEGYPGEAAAGAEITGLERVNDLAGVHVVHAATAHDGGVWRAAGGRVLGVVGQGETVLAARERAYAGIAEIALHGGQHRSDIAAAR